MVSNYPIVEAFAVDVAELAETYQTRVNNRFALSSMITHMPEPIPLCPALGVQSVRIVISNIWNERFYMMLKHLAVKGWLLRDRKGKTKY